MSVNIRRHPRGGWDVDINVLLASGDRHRERRKLGASCSKTTAREWAERREREILLAGPKIREEVPTLEAFAPRFIEGYARANQQKPSGIAAKQSILRLHLVPKLGARSLDAISNEQVQRLKLGLHGKSPKTVNNVLSVLSVLLKQAVEWGVLGKMPCSIRLMRVTRTDAAFHDFEAYDRLLEAAQTIDARSYLIALLGGEAGLRAGEIVALEWADIDLDRRQIIVRHSDWNGEQTAPKNGRIRYVGMTERLATALRKHRHLRHRRVLCKDDGTPLTRQGCWSRVRYAAHRAKVPTGVHILRHTFCSHLAMQGAPMRGVQELVGHQSLAMTQRYSHLTPASLDSTIRLLDNRPVRRAVGDNLETPEGRNS
ncbi:MAG: tyrosine-type recombinase/integrase [Vicinamibacterales bacterium]